MHILEAYALTCGCKIDKPFIQEETIEIPDKQYITFHPYDPKGDARFYEKWQDVIDLITQNSNFTYDIIQTGGVLDSRYNGVRHDYLGKTSYNSLAYLIKHAELHLGFDSLPVHIASYYDRKIVALYGYYSQMSRPYFSNEKNVKIFEPDFSVVKPSFSYNDPHKLINTIDSHEVYLAVLNLLGVSI